MKQPENSLAYYRTRDLDFSTGFFSPLFTREQKRRAGAYVPDATRTGHGVKYRASALEAHIAVELPGTAQRVNVGTKNRVVSRPLGHAARTEKCFVGTGDGITACSLDGRSLENATGRRGVTSQPPRMVHLVFRVDTGNDYAEKWQKKAPWGVAPFFVP
tara:strand:+ start:550 stop:1026 length:477 start_codon:yes stop_codon:yes gene_type:complete